MARKRSKIKTGSFGRGLAMSLAGIRAGGALAIDGALQKLKPGASDSDEALGSSYARREARRFVAELGRLKGTYVKIGQMFALLGEHFLPPVLTDALHELESSTEPLHWGAIKPVLEESLGERVDQLSIEHTALAAASLAQVHRAVVIATGEQICLKIQYPGLADVIDSDFDTVVRMLLLARWIKAGRELDDWLESMREQLHHEIDYRREARMTDQMGELVGKTTGAAVHYYVPRRYSQYCSDRVLALEYIDGFVVTRPEIANLSQARRNTLGKGMLELFFYELYQWGILQTDPNFGNYLIRLDQSRGQGGGGTDELTLLDFGSTMSFGQDFLIHFGNAIAAGQAEDRALLCTSLEGLGCLREDSSDQARQTFSDFCLQLLEPLRSPELLPPEFLNKKGEYCWGKSRLIRRAGRQAASSAATIHFATPSREFAMIARKLVGVFTFIAVLNAEFNAHDLVHRHIDRWMEEG
ncbi:MAG: AarF/ABC1/UbiB kinase family protein [Halieaceae bacterium]|jgi:predicted unusual protein kinase regulating ubiquinone biosynthesis (AarF/ABC1/UbiB family)|nr:AarF/ABC1/UbiB kinase family protein [Halieaceae bacterium]